MDKLEQRCMLKATLRYSTNSKTGTADVPWDERAVARIDYTLKGFALSGMRLDSLDVMSVNYSPYNKE